MEKSNTNHIKHVITSHNNGSHMHKIKLRTDIKNISIEHKSAEVRHLVLKTTRQSITLRRASAGL